VVQISDAPLRSALAHLEKIADTKQFQNIELAPAITISLSGSLAKAGKPARISAENLALGRPLELLRR